jgi:hypothetical protein
MSVRTAGRVKDRPRSPPQRQSREVKKPQIITRCLIYGETMMSAARLQKPFRLASRCGRTMVRARSLKALMPRTELTATTFERRAYSARV